MIRPILANLIGVIFLLVRIWHVGHAFQVSEFAVGRAGVPKSAALRLNCTLQVDVFIPIAHRVFVLIADDEIVDDTRVTFPEDLNAIKS